MNLADINAAVLVLLNLGDDNVQDDGPLTQIQGNY